MGTIHYEKRIVAFIDILGFKSLIEETQKPDCMPEKVENIRDAFSYIYNMLEEHYTKEQVQEINYSTFSDCIVFSFPIHQNDSLFFSLLPLNLATSRTHVETRYAITGSNYCRRYLP